VPLMFTSPLYPFMKPLLATSRRKIERCILRGRIARHRENCNIERFGYC
jgi:hypothetical protein